jgi:ABC-type sugar transport system substrate-binding protein
LISAMGGAPIVDINIISYWRKSMKKRIIFVTFLMVILSVSMVFAGGGAQKSGAGKQLVYRVGFVNIADRDPICYPAMLKFVERMNSPEVLKKIGVDKVEVLTVDSDLDVEKQATNVDTILARGVDLMFIIGVNTEANTVDVEKCNAAGVPVFMVGTEASGGTWKFIGFNESELGQKQGEWCAANLPQNTKICYLQGVPGREAALFREQGFRDGISSRSDLEIISAQSGMFEVAKAMQVTEDWIQAYGNTIGAVVAADTQMTAGAIEALKGANMIDKVIVCGVIHLGTWDADLIRQGEESYAVYVSWLAVGTLCADVAADWYAGNTIPERSHIELQDITPQNYAEIIGR